MSNENMNNNTSVCIFSQRLRELRKSLGLTQTQFAEKVGLSKTAMTNYENIGKNPSLESAFNIAKTFNVSLDWLCGIEDEQTKKAEIKTQGDAIRVIDALVNTKCFDVVPSRNPLDGELTGFVQVEPERLYEEYTYKKSWFDNFMQGYHDLNSLRNNGKITDKLFDMWLSDELEKLDAQPLTVPQIDVRPYSERDDGDEVPF